MKIKFTNNAASNITTAVDTSSTSLEVTSGTGALFPTLSSGEYFYATLVGQDVMEIVKVTARDGDTFTITRGQDGTTAQSFSAGDVIELRIVAADFNDTFSEVNDKLEASIEETTSIVNSALSSLEAMREAQAAKDTEQDAAIVAAQSSADEKVSKSGDTIEYLNLPVGNLRTNNDPAWLSMDLEGSSPGVGGGLITVRSNASQNDPGSVSMLSRNADGSFGPYFTILRDHIITNGTMAFLPTGIIRPLQTADLREIAVAANDEAGFGGLLALRSRTDPGMPGGFVLQTNGPGGRHNLSADSYGGLYWQGRRLAREHKLYVNLGGYIYGSGGVEFSGLNDQTISVHTSITNCNCNCDCGGY